jgi:pimeloyl-ACP methyl ester carboxylesterase
MTALAPAGTLRIGSSDLEYRMIGPAPADAPTIIMLHEGLGSAALWGDFPDRLAAATAAGVLVYSRAGYGASTPVTLPRPLDYMHIEALEILPELLDAIGFRRGLLLGHSDGASIAAIYAGGAGDHRVRGVVMIAPHFIVEDVGVASTLSFVTGIFRSISPTSACRSQSCKASTTSMGQFARSRLLRKSAIVRSM